MPLTEAASAPILGWDRDGIDIDLPRLGRTRIGLRGRHQAANAATADATLDALEAAGIATVPDDARRRGYAAAVWPGRLELVRAADRDVLLDGAHNPAGAAALALALDDLQPFLEPGPVTLVTASMADKDVAGVVAALAGSRAMAGATVICTSLDVPRALPAGDLAALWRASGAPRMVIVEPDPIDAAAAALVAEASGPDRHRRFALPRRGGTQPPRRRPEPARPRPRARSRPRTLTTMTDAGLGTTRIGPTTFEWGERTFVMGILNVTPDSFSGDGLLVGSRDPVEAAVDQARRMVAEGADILDIGGESTRPGHDPVTETEERGRVIPVIAAVRSALPAIPISIDTTKPAIAEAALAAGADLINDVWAVGDDDSLARLAADHGVPLVVMHNRAEPRYRTFMPELIADLQRALDRAAGLGVPWDDLIVDPGFGFGKTPDHNLELLRELGTLRLLGRPILLGTSRKSTLGRVLDLPADERLEATLATTALGIAAGIDLVRVHDVEANVRAARMTDAVVRGTWRSSPTEGGPP